MIVTSGGFSEGKSVRRWVVDWLLIQWLDWMGFLSSHPHTFSRVTQLGVEKGEGRGEEVETRGEATRGDARRLTQLPGAWRPRPPPEKLRNTPTIRTRCQLQLHIPRKPAALRYRPEFAKKKRRNSEKVNRHKNDKRREEKQAQKRKKNQTQKR